MGVEWIKSIASNTDADRLEYDLAAMQFVFYLPEACQNQYRIQNICKHDRE